MAGLYSYYLAPIVLTPAQVNIPQLVNTGNRLGGWLLVQNNSPYKIQVQLPGSGNVLPLDPQTVDKLKVNAGDQQVYILPLLLLPQAAPSSQVDIQVYPGEENEPPGTYPMALNRQAAPTSAASGGFTATATFGPTSSTAAINVFNPAINTKSFIIYRATLLLIITAATSIVGTFGYTTNNIDNALGNALAIVPNDTQSISAGTGSFSLGGTLPTVSNKWEAILAASIGTLFLYVLVPFPSQKKILPGGNAWIKVDAISGTPAYVATMTMEYTEQ